MAREPGPWAVLDGSARQGEVSGSDGLYGHDSAIVTMKKTHSPMLVIRSIRHGTKAACVCLNQRNEGRGRLTPVPGLEVPVYKHPL